MANTRAKSNDAQRARRYLSQALRLNPLKDPQSVLAMRRRALGLEPVKSAKQQPANPRTEENRRAVGAYLQRLQGQFWTLPLEQLRQSLNALNVREMPELRPTVARLRTVAACRGEFPQLASVPDADLGLLRAFKSAVVLPATESGPVRERFLQSVKDRSRLRKVRKMVRLIQSKYPTLYQLERDWFETILKLKKPRADTAQVSIRPEVSFEIGWPVWIVIVVVIRIILSAMQ